MASGNDSGIQCPERRIHTRLVPSDPNPARSSWRPRESDYRDGSRIVPEYPGSKLLIRRRHVELARPPIKTGVCPTFRLAMSRIVSYAKTFERRTTLARPLADADTLRQKIEDFGHVVNADRPVFAACSYQEAFSRGCRLARATPYGIERQNGGRLHPGYLAYVPLRAQGLYRTAPCRTRMSSRMACGSLTGAAGSSGDLHGSFPCGRESRASQLYPGISRIKTFRNTTPKAVCREVEAHHPEQKNPRPLRPARSSGGASANRTHRHCGTARSNSARICFRRSARARLSRPRMTITERQAINTFVARYPRFDDPFDDPEYRKYERDYKWEAHCQVAAELLSGPWPTQGREGAAGRPRGHVEEADSHQKTKTPILTL